MYALLNGGGGHELNDFGKGMIWRMDPFAMPPAFCHGESTLLPVMHAVQPLVVRTHANPIISSSPAQIYIISLGSFLLTGCCAVCSVVTTRIVTEYSKGRTQMPSEYVMFRHFAFARTVISPSSRHVSQILPLEAHLPFTSHHLSVCGICGADHSECPVRRHQAK